MSEYLIIFQHHTLHQGRLMMFLYVRKRRRVSCNIGHIKRAFNQKLTTTTPLVLSHFQDAFNNYHDCFHCSLCRCRCSCSVCAHVLLFYVLRLILPPVSFLRRNATNVELSASCTQALKDVDNNPEVQSCLQPDAFVELWQTSPTESIVGPVNTWLSEICATPACSNDLWPTIVQNITTGCAEDIKSQGFTTEDASTGVQYIQEYYPIVRDIMCLKE